MLSDHKILSYYRSVRGYLDEQWEKVLHLFGDNDWKVFVGGMPTNYVTIKLVYPFKFNFFLNDYIIMI